MFQMTQLPNGRTVLAKATKYGTSAVTYANRTQAEKKVAEIRAAGIACYSTRYRGRPIYVVFGE
jgi:hypothetical protein